MSEISKLAVTITPEVGAMIPDGHFIGKNAQNLGALNDELGIPDHRRIMTTEPKTGAGMGVIKIQMAGDETLPTQNSVGEAIPDKDVLVARLFPHEVSEGKLTTEALNTAIAREILARDNIKTRPWRAAGAAAVGAALGLAIGVGFKYAEIKTGFATSAEDLVEANAMIPSAAVVLGGIKAFLAYNRRAKVPGKGVGRKNPPIRVMTQQQYEDTF